MTKDFIKILKGYISLNRRWIIPLYTFPFFWRVISLFSSLDEKIQSNIFIVSEKLVLTFLFPLLSSYLLLSFTLALSFKRKGHESWFSRLPIDSFTLVTIPLFLLFTFGTFIYFLFQNAWEFAVELTGYPIIFTLGILPLGTYISVKSIKKSSTGIFFGFIMSFIIVGAAEILIRFLDGDFGLIENYSFQLKFSFLRPIIEVLCLSAILFIVLKVENLPKRVTNPMGLLCLGLGFVGMISFFQFQENKTIYRSLLKSLDQVIFELEKNRNRCDQFRSFVVEALPGSSAESSMRDRSLVIQAIAQLKSYPHSRISKDLLNSYYSNVPKGFAEGLILQKAFRIYDCHLIAKFDLQKSLINTLYKKPDYLTHTDLRSIQQVIWASLYISATSGISLIESAINAELLDTLQQYGLIEQKFKWEVLEVVRECEKARGELKKLRVENSLFVFRAPSKGRIHLTFEFMKKENQVVNSINTLLYQVIAKIDPSQK